MTVPLTGATAPLAPGADPSVDGRGRSFAVVQDVAASWEWYRDAVTAAVDPPPQGLILFVAGPTDEGVRVIGTWQDLQAWRRFQAERLAPAVAALAGPPPPPAVERQLEGKHLVVGARTTSPRAATPSKETDHER